MSDLRRLSKPEIRIKWVESDKQYPFESYPPASPADLLAAIRGAVESGTIEGEVVQPHVADGDGPYTPNLHLDPGTYLVIPLVRAWRRRKQVSDRYMLPPTSFRGRSPRLTWLPERHMCCDPKADIICPYNETWREYGLRLLACSWLGHRWHDLGTWLMCLRCRWFESKESADE